MSIKNALSLCAGLAAVGAAAPALAAGLEVKLTRPGFDLVSEVARTQFINGLQNAHLPEQTISIPLVSTVRVQDVTYSVTMKSLDVFPADGALGINAAIDDIVVHIGALRFESWLVPALGTTCTGAAVELGRHSPVPLQARLDAGLGRRGIELSLRDLSLDLNRGQYAGRGPGDCRGPFDIEDYFTRFVVSAVIANARPFIEEGVRLEASRLVPKIEGMLNEMSNKPLVVGVPDLVVTPATKIALKGRPSALVLSPEGLDLSMQLSVLPAAESRAAARPAAQPAGAHVPGQLYGTLGIQPALVNQILAATLVNGSNWIQLTPALDPLIEDMTSRSSLSAFWPDLDKTASTGETLQLFARVVRAPELSTLQAANGWHVSVPDLELHYKLNRDGAWIDYVSLHVKAEIDGAPTIDAGKLTLKILKGSASVSSEWSAGYTPVDPSFDADTANSFFNSALELVATSDTPPSFALPALPVAGFDLTAKSLRIENGLTKIDLIEAGTPAH